MAFYKGKDLRISLGGKVLYHASECGMNISKTFEEIATKDTNGTNSIPGEYTWSLSSSSLISNKPALSTTQLDLKDLVEAQLAGTPFEIEFTTGTVGDVIFTGNVYVENVDIAAATGSVATGSFSFKGDGELTVASVA
jgi:hypothetical protein